MSLEKEVLTASAILGFLGTIFGFIYRGQNRQIASIRDDAKGFVTDKTSLERFKHVTEKMDDFKGEISKLWDVVTEARDSGNRCETILKVMAGNKKKRQGD